MLFNYNRDLTEFLRQLILILVKISIFNYYTAISFPNSLSIFPITSRVCMFCQGWIKWFLVCHQNLIPEAKGVTELQIFLSFFSTQAFVVQFNLRWFESLNFHPYHKSFEPNKYERNMQHLDSPWLRLLEINLHSPLSFRGHMSSLGIPMEI